MTETDPSVFLWFVDAALALLGVGILLGAFRLLRGPSLPDRVVALDLIATLGVGAIGVFAIRENEPVFLLVGIVLALVMFVGTIAFAYYLEQGSTS
jgi:multicomponent Na+:H+ antiporter subunit F